MIKLQLLPRQQWRTPDGVERVRQVATALGLRPTVGGSATLSCELEPARFAPLFGVDAEVAGTQALPIPEPLREYVESITVAPRHLRM